MARFRADTAWAFSAAWAASVAPAFVTGCIYAVFTGSNDHASFLSALIRADRQALQITATIGVVFAIAVGFVSGIAIVLLAAPTYLVVSERFVSSPFANVGAGIVIAIISFAISVVVQNKLSPPLKGDLLFELLAALAGGIAASVAFWSVARNRGQDLS